MVKSAVIRKEIAVFLENKVGGLASITKLVSEKAINIEAVAGYVTNDGSKAEVMLLTGNNQVAISAIKAGGYKDVKERDVVFVEVEDRPGVLEKLSQKLSEKGLDLKHIYGTTCSSACPTRIVIASSDVQKTIAALKG